MTFDDTDPRDAPPAAASKRSVFVGTAGWSIPRRYAPAFPVQGSHLTRYASRLNAVEINSSFYRPHRAATYARWAGSVPEHFRFAVKLPKTITHAAKLADCDALLDRFLDDVSGLGTRLGVLLVQLAPSLAFEAATAAAFFAALRRRTEVGVALEPRHGSWFEVETDTLLDGWQIARVAADPPRVPGGDAPGGWRGLAYHRLHGSPHTYYSDYGAERLTAIARATGSATDVPTWCMFDNTAASHALGNALAVAALTGSGQGEFGAPAGQQRVGQGHEDGPAR